MLWIIICYYVYCPSIIAKVNSKSSISGEVFVDTLLKLSFAKKYVYCGKLFDQMIKRNLI